MLFCERNIPLGIIYQDKKLSRKNRSKEKIMIMSLILDILNVRYMWGYQRRKLNKKLTTWDLGVWGSHGMSEATWA